MDALTNASPPQRSTYSNQNSFPACPPKSVPLPSTRRQAFTFPFLSQYHFLNNREGCSSLTHSPSIVILYIYIPDPQICFLYADFLDLAIPMSVLQYSNDVCLTSSICFYTESAPLKHFWRNFSICLISIKTSIASQVNQRKRTVFTTLNVTL